MKLWGNTTSVMKERSSLHNFSFFTCPVSLNTHLENREGIDVTVTKFHSDQVSGSCIRSVLLFFLKRRKYYLNWLWFKHMVPQESVNEPKLIENTFTEIVPLWVGQSLYQSAVDKERTPNPDLKSFLMAGHTIFTTRKAACTCAEVQLTHQMGKFLWHRHLILTTAG